MKKIALAALPLAFALISCNSAGDPDHDNDPVGTADYDHDGDGGPAAATPEAQSAKNDTGHGAAGFADTNHDGN